MPTTPACAARRVHRTKVRALLGVLGSGAILAALLYFADFFLIGW